MQKAENLYRELDKQNNIRAGYYLRHSGEMTIVISVSKNTDDKAKVSFRVLKTVTKYTRQMGLSVDDGIYILATKFFLYYLFHERHLTIKPILDDKRCVICTKGKNTRILELGKLLDADGSADEKHEIEAVITYLNDNQANDTTITVCGSTIVYKNKGEASSEFDGIIIYPNKSEKQIVLIEAKNTNEKPGYGKKCLHKKLKNLGIPYNYKDIIVFNHDAYFIVTV